MRIVIANGNNSADYIIKNFKITYLFPKREIKVF